MNTPNKLTLFRIFLIPFFVFFLLMQNLPHRFLFALIIFCIAAITDHFDGELARRSGQITDFGKFLDPLADKMLVMSAFISFVQLGVVGALPVIIILMREFTVTSVRLVAMGSGKVISANIWGKIKTVSQIVAIIIILLTQYIMSISPNIFGLSQNHFNLINFVAVWVSVLFAVISGTIYMVDNIKFISLSQK